MYDIPESTYLMLGKLTRGRVRKICMTIFDNCFSAEKGNILYDVLSAGRELRRFTMLNVAVGVDYKHDEYDKFDDNVAPLKSLPNMAVSVGWQKQGCC